MFGSVILDVAIGLILIYLLFSLVSVSIREWIASLLKTRSTTLDKGIHELLGDAQLVEALYNHPLINSLYRGGAYADAKSQRQLPSYIPAKSFSAALLDMIVRGTDTSSLLQSGSEARPVTIENVRAQIGRIQNPRVQRAVLSALDTANGDLDAVQANLEHWFDSTMDRVSGWYKQHTQVYVFCIALLIVIVADADSLNIAQRLYTDPSMRQAAVAIAGTVSDTSGATGAIQAKQQLAQLGLPLVGWQQVVVDHSAPWRTQASAYGDHALRALIGWLITALAVSLGAPFWFDTLGRIMVIRNTVKPNQKSPVEASDDRQVKGGGGGGGAAPASRPSVPVAPTPIVVKVTAAMAGPPDFMPQEWANGHPQGGVL